MMACMQPGHRCKAKCTSSVVCMQAIFLHLLFYEQKIAVRDPDLCTHMPIWCMLALWYTVTFLCVRCEASIFAHHLDEGLLRLDTPHLPAVPVGKGRTMQPCECSTSGIRMSIYFDIAMVKSSALCYAAGKCHAKLLKGLLQHKLHFKLDTGMKH